LRHAMPQRVTPQLRMTNWPRTWAFYEQGLGFRVDWERGCPQPQRARWSLGSPIRDLRLLRLRTAALHLSSYFRLLRTQRQFAQVMFVQFAVGVSGMIQRERARNVDFKRTGLDETVEPLELLGAWLDIVAFDLDAGRRF